MLIPENNNNKKLNVKFFPMKCYFNKYFILQNHFIEWEELEACTEARECGPIFQTGRTGRIKTSSFNGIC